MALGIQITSLDALSRLAEQKRAVVCPAAVGFKSPRPAQFVINMSGTMILRFMQSGLYLYEKGSDSK